MSHETLNTAELALLVTLAARQDPNRYSDYQIKALIWKAKALAEASRLNPSMTLTVVP